MAPTKQQRDAKERNRNKILQILEKSGATFKELQIGTGLTPPALIKHLKEMSKEGIVEDQIVHQAEGRRRVEYVLTDDGRKKEKLVRASVAKAYQIIMKTLPSDHPAATTLSDLSELAETDPKFFSELGQWISDYMALATSEESRRWIFKRRKSGIDQLQGELTKRMARLTQKNSLNADELITVLRTILNTTREIISKG